MKQFYEEQKNLIPTSVRIKCPYCLQVFKAFTSEFEEEKPDFQCSSCQKTFWINTKDRENILLGKPADMQKNTPLSPSRLGVSTKICPRCTEEVPINDQECSYCGVVFIKMIEGVGASFQLRGEWAKVVKNWHDDGIHDAFLRSCYKQNELVYGISCYGRVLNNNKDNRNNRKAREMIKRMESLTWFFEDEISLPKFSLRQVYTRLKNWLTGYAFSALMLALFLCLALYIFA